MTLIKGENMFGFTLDKHQSDQRGKGVYILAVDNEPARSDGRLHEGDEIIKVSLPHQELCITRQ